MEAGRRESGESSLEMNGDRAPSSASGHSSCGRCPHPGIATSLCSTRGSTRDRIIPAYRQTMKAGWRQGAGEGLETPPLQQSPWLWSRRTDRPSPDRSSRPVDPRLGYAVGVIIPSDEMRSKGRGTPHSANGWRGGDLRNSRVSRRFVELI